MGIDTTEATTALTYGGDSPENVLGPVLTALASDRFDWYVEVTYDFDNPKQASGYLVQHEDFTLTIRPEGEIHGRMGDPIRIPVTDILHINVP